MKIESTQMAPIPPTEVAPKKEEHPEVRAVARKFEAVFVNQLVAAMRKTVVKGGLVPESNAERVYQGMLDDQYVERISESDQLGLSQMIYDHLLQRTGAR